MQPCFVLLALIVATSFTTTAAAQNVLPGMKMHRIKAGEPDASGWTMGGSTGGRFSVRLPCKFNDFTQAENDPNSPVDRCFVVGGRTQDGIKFVATRIVYRNGAKSAADFFAKFETHTGNLESQRPRPFRFKGKRAVDSVLTGESTVGFQRVVLLESDLVLMIVESSSENRKVAEHLAKPFFDSLAITAR